jgi:putative DNA primase/helicase
MEGIYHNFIATATELSSFEVAKFFSHICESKLRFTPEAGWLSYQEDSGIWLRVTEEKIRRLVVELIENLEEVVTETEIQSSLKKLKTLFRINEIIGFLKSYLFKNFSEFDANSFVLALKNCILDLETLHYADDHERANFYVTKRMDANFIEGFTKAPSGFSRWLDFLHSILPDDIVEFLQIFLGYSLTGSTEERKFLIFYGSGANGKTTLTNVIRKIWHDYAFTSGAGLFMKNSHDKIFQLAHIKGARLGIVPELPTGTLDISIVKLLTGQDNVGQGSFTMIISNSNRHASGLLYAKNSRGLRKVQRPYGTGCW